MSFCGRKMLTAAQAEANISPIDDSPDSPQPVRGTPNGRSQDRRRAQPARQSDLPDRPDPHASALVSTDARVGPHHRGAGHRVTLNFDSFCYADCLRSVPSSHPAADGTECPSAAGLVTDQGSTAGRVIRGKDAPGSRHDVRGSGRAQAAPCDPAGRTSGVRVSGMPRAPWRPTLSGRDAGSVGRFHFSGPTFPGR